MEPLDESVMAIGIWLSIIGLIVSILSLIIVGVYAVY